MWLIDKAEYAEALHYLDTLMKQLSPKERLVALYWKVSCLGSLNEWDQAMTYVDEALTQVDAQSPVGICLKLQRAFLLQFKEGADRAVLEMRTLMSRYSEELKGPDLFWIYVQAKTDLGVCLSMGRRYAEARKELEEALSVQDQPLSRYYIHFRLGEALLQLGDLMKAQDHFERARDEQKSAPKA